MTGASDVIGHVLGVWLLHVGVRSIIQETSVTLIPASMMPKVNSVLTILVSRWHWIVRNHRTIEMSSHSAGFYDFCLPDFVNDIQSSVMLSYADGSTDDFVEACNFALKVLIKT